MLIYEREQFLVVDLPLFILFCDLQGLQLLIYLEQFLVFNFWALIILHLMQLKAVTTVKINLY